MRRSVAVGFILAWACAAEPPRGSAAPVLAEFKGAYGSSLAEHERFGRELGKAFADGARKRLARKRNALLVEWCTTDVAGKRVLAVFAEAHERLYPTYMAELRGIAQGVGVSFESVLALNLHQELAHFAPNASAVAPAASHCSDYALWPWVAHNEDSGVDEVGTLFLASVQIDGASFRAAVYAGDLPSGAFAFNSWGVGYSLNMVDPDRAHLGGKGRGFVSRALLQARSMAEAIALATADGQCVGHSYQLFATRARAEGGGGEIAQVEAVAGGVHSVRRVVAGGAPLFHSNHLLYLPGVAQRISTSSARRLARARALPPPASARALLAVLGDQSDRSFPIFHDDEARKAGDISMEATLASALVDVARATLTVFAGNPARAGSVLAVLPIPRPDDERAAARLDAEPRALGVDRVVTA